MDIRRLPRNYATIEAVWADYPNGGQEGDYFYMTSAAYPSTSGTKYRWNKYALLWENAATVTDDPARESTTFADVNVQNNVKVGGSMRVQDNLRVEGVLTYTRLESNDKGMYATLLDLQTAYPNPKAGWWATIIVENDTKIFIAEGDPVAWTATGVSGADLTPTVISTEEMEAWLS